MQGKYRLSEPWVDRGSDQEKQCAVQVGMLADKLVRRLEEGRGVSGREGGAQGGGKRAVLRSVEGQAGGRGGGVMEDGWVGDNSGEGAGISCGGKGAQSKECVGGVPGQLVSNRSGGQG